MKIFWILLVLVILFVVGSASALRYFDHRQLKQKNFSPENEKQDENN